MRARNWLPATCFEHQPREGCSGDVQWGRANLGAAVDAGGDGGVSADSDADLATFGDGPAEVQDDSGGVEREDGIEAPYPCSDGRQRTNPNSGPNVAASGLETTDCGVAAEETGASEVLSAETC